MVPGVTSESACKNSWTILWWLSFVIRETSFWFSHTPSQINFLHLALSTTWSSKIRKVWMWLKKLKKARTATSEFLQWWHYTEKEKFLKLIRIHFVNTVHSWLLRRIWYLPFWKTRPRFLCGFSISKQTRTQKHLRSPKVWPKQNTENFVQNLKCFT